ncbi:MarR family transcriptional regulator [Mycolicibacterium fortuitum]|uniref:MarR family transcriptional regulator n=1 Tax=Mycolicibacterium fortuitum TaxID=1766 RepID=UPI000941E2C6
MSSHLSQPPGGYSSCFADSRIEGASGRSGIGPSTIASRTGIAPTTVAAILTRLERDGRIDRRPNPEDARSSLLAIADDTGRELTRLYEGLNNEFARTITALTTPERTTITGVPTRSLDHHPPIRAFRACSARLSQIRGWRGRFRLPRVMPTIYRTPWWPTGSARGRRWPTREACVSSTVAVTILCRARRQRETARPAVRVRRRTHPGPTAGRGRRANRVE